MFSMLGVNLAYVTAIGKLIGVVGLKELRSGIENANSGILARSNSNKSSDTTTSKEGMNQFTFSVNSLSIVLQVFLQFLPYKIHENSCHSRFHEILKILTDHAK